MVVSAKIQNMLEMGEERRWKFILTKNPMLATSDFKVFFLKRTYC